MAQNFFITGFPRSRTAWLSALFSTDFSDCIHEPFVHLVTCEDIFDYLKGSNFIHKGLSDSSMAYYHDFISKKFPGCPIVVIEREEGEVTRSLVNFLNIHWNIADAIVKKIKVGLDIIKTFPNVLCVPYDHLDKVDTIEKIWKHCCPDIIFNVQRTVRFQYLTINQNIAKAQGKLKFTERALTQLN